MLGKDEIDTTALYCNKKLTAGDVMAPLRTTTTNTKSQAILRSFGSLVRKTETYLV